MRSCSKLPLHFPFLCLLSCRLLRGIKGTAPFIDSKIITPNRRFKVLLSKEFYGVCIRMVSEMFIKGKHGFNAKLIYQGKAGAVGKTQPLVFKSSKDKFSGCFNFFCYSENNNVTPGYFIHEFNRSRMTASGLKESINFS